MFLLYVPMSVEVKGEIQDEFIMKSLVLALVYIYDNIEH